MEMFKEIQQPLVRRLQCESPQSVKKYQQLLYSLAEDADIADRVLLLEETATVPLSDDSAEGYEELERIITRCMIQAEKKI